MKLAIPVFHTEFDALQLSFPWFGEIPPYGDFGDFSWLLFSRSSHSLVFIANDGYGWNRHGLRIILAYVISLADSFGW